MRRAEELTIQDKLHVIGQTDTGGTPSYSKSDGAAWYTQRIDRSDELSMAAVFLVR